MYSTKVQTNNPAIINKTMVPAPSAATKTALYNKNRITGT